MLDPPFPILFEDNHLLAVCKPPGLPVMGVPEGRETVLSQAKQYVKRKYDKPGNVYLGVVSRLDAPVTGVLLLARTSKAAKRLNEQFRGGTVAKRYWALVGGPVELDEETCVDWLRHDERHRKVHVTHAEHPEAREARLRYRVRRRMRSATLLEIRLETGRKHQIRVQLAQRGFPIIGDRKYGSRTAFPAGIALHSRQLTIQHPVGQREICLRAAVPVCWDGWGVAEPR